MTYLFYLAVLTAILYTLVALDIVTGNRSVRSLCDVPAMLPPKRLLTLRTDHQGVTIILVSLVVMLMISSVRAQAETVLPPCPSSPNCVSSMATDTHRIEPLAIRGDAKAWFARLRTVLAHLKDTTIIASDDAHIQVEFRTLLGFVDDGLFVLDVPNGQIQIRSAARSGYWDMGKNRRRMEEIRRQ